MDSIEFILEPDDFNQLLEVTANEGNVIQLFGSGAVFRTQIDRCIAIWKRFGAKYRFVPETVEANLPNRDARYFMAVPLEKPKPTKDIDCLLCNSLVNVNPAGSCIKSHIPGCAYATPKPKKLIRDKIVDVLKEGEWQVVEDKEELNYLFGKKVKEELAEIEHAKYTDVKEFADLINVAFRFAEANGFTKKQLMEVIIEKEKSKGTFSNIALTNLNPNNPSNKIYFNGKG